MRGIFLCLFVFAASPLAAVDVEIEPILKSHVLPGYQRLADEAADLASSAAENCASDNPELIAAYHDAFDAWVSVSHLRFGPSEQDDRAFALAFWPDPRGSTPKALSTLLRVEDAVVTDPNAFATVSVAARGFYALEFLLFDTRFSSDQNPTYLCALIKAVTNDMSSNADAILAGWQDGYADRMSTPGNNIYRTQKEAAQQLFTALLTGLESTSQTRLGRPLGTFEQPRANRAEARRSERSLRHIMLSLKATKKLAQQLSMGNADVDKTFGAALQRAENLDDPIFAGVAEPEGRLRVELLQQDIDMIRRILTEQVGPSLGIAAGFNALDGD